MYACSICLKEQFTKKKCFDFRPGTVSVRLIDLVQMKWLFKVHVNVLDGQGLSSTKKNNRYHEIVFGTT